MDTVRSAVVYYRLHNICCTKPLKRLQKKKTLNFQDLRLFVHKNPEAEAQSSAQASACSLFIVL